jgi:hypothetical protein
MWVWLNLNHGSIITAWDDAQSQASAVGIHHSLMASNLQMAVACIFF